MSKELQDSRKIILIVEDDLEIRDSLKDFFEFEGYSVFAAENGKVALNLLELIPKPGLIFLDLMMPVMNGWEFARRLSLDGCLHSVPVVVLTAFPEKAEGIGATRIVKKPFELDILVDLAKKYCDGNT